MRAARRDRAGACGPPLPGPTAAGGQVRAEALVGTGRPQQCPQAGAHLAAGDLAAQQGVAAIEQPVADGGRGNGTGRAGRGRPADGSWRPLWPPPGPDRAGSQPDRRRRPRCARRRGAVHVRSPIRCAPRATPSRSSRPNSGTRRRALVTGRVDVQGIAVGQGGPQGRGAVPMQSLQGSQEAIAQRGDGTGRQGEALAGQRRADLPRAGGGGDSGPVRPTRSGPSRSAGRTGPVRPVAARPRPAGRRSGRHCLRISRARSVPAARVTSMRVLLFCGLRGRPQWEHWCSSATKSTPGEPRRRVWHGRSCRRTARVAGLFQQQRQEAVDPLFRRSGGARSARTRPGPAPSGMAGSGLQAAGHRPGPGARDGGPAPAAPR